MSDLPRWVDEPVEIHAPDPGWRAKAERECEALRRCLAPWLLSDVQHIGSTAVPGLPAKPIIDLQALVADLSSAPAIRTAVAPGEWHLVPAELDRRPWRRLLIKVSNTRRSVHLHLMTPGSRRWSEHLLFRDALRTDRQLLEAYLALKRDLAARGLDRESYSEAKAQFVQNVIESAASRHI